MKTRLGLCLTSLWFVSLTPPGLSADEAGDAAVKKVIEAVGGEEKLLKLFQFRERVVISSMPPAPLKPEEKGNRTSVVEVGGDWWIGAAKRDKDKVRVLAWAWSLRILLAPESQVTRIGEITVSGKPAYGLRVAGSVKDPVDLYFEAENHRMVAFDYQDSRHFVSEWKATAEGHPYASRTIGYRFSNREKRTLSEKPWYQTDILEPTVLKELPVSMTRCASVRGVRDLPSFVFL